MIDLLNKIVRVTLSRSTAHGVRYGLVRKQTPTTLTIQQRSPGGVSKSAQYRGIKIVLRNHELDNVYVRLRSGLFKLAK